MSFKKDKYLVIKKVIDKAPDVIERIGKSEFARSIAKDLSDAIDPTKVGVAVTAISDALEAAGGAAGGAFSSAYDSFLEIKQKEYDRISSLEGAPELEITEEDRQAATEFATGVAQKAGGAGLAMSLITDKFLGDNELAEKIFGRTDSGALKLVERLKQSVVDIGTSTATQARNEAIEESVVEYIAGSSIVRLMTFQILYLT